MKLFILKYSLILIVGLLVEWWIIWFSPLNIPETIPSTPIKIDGVLLSVIILSVLIVAQKRFIKSNPNTTVLNLTALGAAIILIAELTFQAIRQAFLYADTYNQMLYYFFRGTILVSLFGAILSFFVAFQIKTKKTGQLILIILGFLFALNFIIYFFPNLFGKYQ